MQSQLYVILEWNKTKTKRNKKKRSRPRHSRIYWFNPPYDERVRTNVIQRMFASLERCYPRGHRLHNIFNRHTIKASYRTLANMSKQIAIHNSIVIKEYNNNHITQQPRVPFPLGPAKATAPSPRSPRSPAHTQQSTGCVACSRASRDSGSGQGSLHPILRHTPSHA